MLTIKAIMGSGAEEILNFKTCCGPRAFDQNLEILITNQGDVPVGVPSECELILEGPATRRIRNLMPHGLQIIPPGETIAFYCYLDEVLWSRAGSLVFQDDRGNRHTAKAGAFAAEELS